MIPDPPEKSVWLDIPDSCRIAANSPVTWTFMSCLATPTRGERAVRATGAGAFRAPGERAAGRAAAG